jgi:hypothetical protein
MYDVSFENQTVVEGLTYVRKDLNTLALQNFFENESTLVTLLTLLISWKECTQDAAFAASYPNEFGNTDMVETSTVTTAATTTGTATTRTVDNCNDYRRERDRR